jgi:hypothetical protein
MILRFARNGARLVAAASIALGPVLPFACAAGDSAEAGPNGSSPSTPTAAIEGGAAVDAGSSDDAAVVGDGTSSPDRDPSAPDATVDVGVGAMAPDAGDAADAAVDGAAGDGGTGVLCGVGADPLRCAGSKPLCCETSNAGAPTYACVATGACSAGYPIACAARADCAGTLSCCHYGSSIKCEPTCPIASSVCDPSVPGSCGSGHSCNVPLLLAGSASPYMMCSP